MHHAAANGHMHILSFLVNFGANLYALDNEFHTAMDVAASRDRMDCVRFLDAAATQQTNQNPRKVANLKKEAVKEAEKRVKLCEKVKKKHQSRMDKLQHGASYTGSVAEVANASALSNGSMNGVNEHFSKLVAAEKSDSFTARVKGTLQKKLGKKDKGTLQKSGGDGNVIFLKQDSTATEKPMFVDVFSEQDESKFDRDVIADFDDDDDDNGEPGRVKQSIFNRPGLGGLIFMKKMGMEVDDFPRGNDENLDYLVQNDLFEEEDTADPDLPWQQEDLGLDDDEDKETSPLDVFLSTMSLPEFSLAFRKEHLDLDSLMLCTDEDLRGIRIQLGPRKKILEAAARRKNTLESPGIIKDSSL